MGLLMEAIKDFAFILKPFLWIWLIWTIIMIISKGGMGGGGGIAAGEGLARAARGAARHFGPKERSMRKKESAEAAEIGQEADVQRKLVKEEQNAIKWLEANLSPERGIAKEILDDIQRLEWVNKVLQYIARIRNDVQATRYKRMVEEQLGLVAKHFVSEEKITEEEIKIIHGRIERFIDVELRAIKKEDRAERIILRLIKREVRQEDRPAMRRFLKEKKHAIKELIGGIADIVHKKKDLTDKIVKGLEDRIRRQNHEFNEFIQRIISNVWHDQIKEAAININKAIELKKEQLNVARTLDEHAKEIEELERKQFEAEGRLKQFFEEFEQNKHKYREETERGAKLARREAKQLEFKF